MSQTNYLQIAKSGLQRTAGPYTCAKRRQRTAKEKTAERRPVRSGVLDQAIAAVPCRCVAMLVIGNRGSSG
jgi:hypothetical protein